MVHGAFCGGWTFDVFRQPFEAAGHTVQAPDLLGRGGQGAVGVATGKISGGTIAGFVLSGAIVASSFGSLTEVYGDLIRAGSSADDPPGQTELAARVLAKRLDLSPGAIRRDLERGDGADFPATRLYERLFERAEQAEGRPLPRALLPQIRLDSPKISRKLTTDWFARRVDERYQRCLLRAPAPATAGPAP